MPLSLFGHEDKVGSDLMGELHRNKTKFADPWATYSSEELPRTLTGIFEWCEAVWYRNSTYRKAMERVAAYFLTDLKIEDADDTETDKITDYFNDEMGLMAQLQAVGEDFLCYGNGFVSLSFPFTRYLECDNCHTRIPMRSAEYKFDLHTERITADCQICKGLHEFKHVDLQDISGRSAYLTRWSVRDVEIKYNPVTSAAEYFAKIPASVENGVRQKDPFYLETTPWEMVQAACRGKRLRMFEGEFFHLKEPTLCGVENRGWGIPRLVSNMPQAFYIQVLKRLNEAQALDWIMPVRVLSPKGMAGPDPLGGQHMGHYKAQLDQSIKNSRFDPATWNFLPFPVEYQALGGEGLKLATHQLIDAATDEMLNGSGVPAELYRGTMQLQALPTALRLFQQTWRPFVHIMNELVQWVSDKVSDVKNWDSVKMQLEPVTLADDLEQKHVMLNLMGAQMVSPPTALAPFGINAREETKRMFEYQRHQQELERQFQREEMERQQAEEQIQALEMQKQQMAAMGGMPPMGGGMPPMGGGMAPHPQPMGGMPPNPAAPASGQQTPQDMIAQADQLAQQLVQMPYEPRRQTLAEMKKHNPALHSIVKQRMEDLRQQVSSEARMALSSGQM